MDVLSVFMTPWTKPTPSQRATRLACASITLLEQGERVVAAAGGVGVVARERVGGERDQRLAIPARGEELERAHAEVARRHAGEDRARQHLFAHDALARRRDGEGARGRDAQRRHRLADEVLAQHGAERGASVAAARKRRPSRALELDVAPPSVLADDLAQQDGATVAELGDEAAELMAGVGERERLCAGRDLVADQQRRAGAGREQLRAGAEQLGERLVDPHDPRVADLRGRDARVEAVRQTRIAVVESEHLDRLCHRGRL